MAIEIFGFAVKPEISIGDIAAISALISSALIFWFGYSRTRRSEQVKVARDLMDRIELKLQQVKKFMESYESRVEVSSFSHNEKELTDECYDTSARCRVC